MAAEVPALQQEVPAGDNATPPPVVEEQVESEAPEGVEESASEQEQKPQDDQKKPEQESKPEIELLIEGEEPRPDRESAPAWVKELRKEHRELKTRNAELERTLKAQQAPEQALDPGPKPTLEGCDFDPEAFEKNLEAWHIRKQEAAQRVASAQASIESQRRAWNDKLHAYGKARDELARQIPTFAEAEAFAQSILDVTQQGVIVAAADTPALVICALGQNPKLAQDLASEKDPIRFAFKVAKLEARR